MADHPQTNRQSERSNQWLEQYLWFWCNGRQDDWADWLPMAEFTHNSWPNAATHIPPFELLTGRVPQTTWPKKPTTVPSVEQHLEELSTIWQQAQDNMRKAQETLAKHPTAFTPHQEGELVWLEGTHIKTSHPIAKLAPKHHGPFKITHKSCPPSRTN